MQVLTSTCGSIAVLCVFCDFCSSRTAKNRCNCKNHWNSEYSLKLLESELLEPQKPQTMLESEPQKLQKLQKLLEPELLEPQKLLESEPLEPQSKKAGIAHAYFIFGKLESERSFFEGNKL